MLFYAFQKKGFNKSAEGVKNIFIYIPGTVKERMRWGGSPLCRLMEWLSPWPNRWTTLTSGCLWRCLMVQCLRAELRWGSSPGTSSCEVHRIKNGMTRLKPARAASTQVLSDNGGWGFSSDTSDGFFFVIVSLKVKYFSVYIAWTLLCCICILILRQEQHCI